MSLPIGDTPAVSKGQRYVPHPIEFRFRDSGGVAAAVTDGGQVAELASLTGVTPKVEVRVDGLHQPAAEEAADIRLRWHQLCLLLRPLGRTRCPRASWPRARFPRVHFPVPIALKS